MVEYVNENRLEEEKYWRMGWVTMVRGYYLERSSTEFSGFHQINDTYYIY